MVWSALPAVWSCWGVFGRQADKPEPVSRLMDDTVNPGPQEQLQLANVLG